MTAVEPDAPRFDATELDGSPILDEDDRAVAGCEPPAYEPGSEPYHGALDRADAGVIVTPEGWHE